jgi:alkanesulfonate monooxygenase SsuD/methylene tetrahydromethanopterin reductase-like flavin-dependent oxidoreductase (luciferase family)
MKERLDALEEQMDLIRRHWEPGPFSFEGSYYRAKDLDALPKPVQRPRPPMILGGRGGDRSLHIAARFADEYNTVFSTPAEMAELRTRLDRACEDEGRDPATLPLSLMTGWLVAEDEEELRDRAGRLAEWRGAGDDPDAFLASVPDSWITGTVPAAIEHLRKLSEAGVKRIMAQHLLHRDLEAIELIGVEVIPAVAR